MTADTRPCNDAMTTGTRLVRIDLGRLAALQNTLDRGDRPGRHSIERAGDGVYAQETRRIGPAVRAEVTEPAPEPAAEEPDQESAEPRRPGHRTRKLIMLLVNGSRRFRS